MLLGHLVHLHITIQKIYGFWNFFFVLQFQCQTCPEELLTALTWCYYFSKQGEEIIDYSLSSLFSPSRFTSSTNIFTLSF